MELEHELNRTKNQIGLVSGSLKINEYDDAERNITANIDPRKWNIEINLKKDYDPIQTKRQKAYARVKKIKNGKKQLLEDILYHELAHWEMPFSSGFGCPYDVYNSDLILEAVKEALPENKKEHASYLTNAFADLMINPRCKEYKEEYKGDFSGQVLFWDNEGHYCKEKGQQHYNPFYEAFVKLNMHLFGDDIDKSLLRKHYSNSEEIDKAVEKVVKELNLQENIQDTSSLFIKKKWPEMASKFAKNLADLLDENPLERLSAFARDYEGEGGEKQEQPGNGVEQKAGSREGKEEIAFGRYASGKAQSPNITSYEQLDSLYRRLARSIPVHVEAITQKQSLSIAPLNYRPFDEETDDINKIKPTKLFPTETEEGITFGHQKEPITVVERSKVQRRSFPDFKMVVLDNSGSMAEGINGNQGDTTFIPWGDNSKYHYALLGFYGIEQFLQLHGISQYIGHGLSLFSSNTRYKESNFRDLKELRKLALSPDFAGDTRIDANTLVDALIGKESFVLSLSDGEIWNWEQAKPEFERLAKDNYFAHIQIGSSNQFTNDLEAIGMPVFYVNSGDELSKLMVNVATDTYRRFTTQQ